MYRCLVCDTTAAGNHGAPVCKRCWRLRCHGEKHPRALRLVYVEGEELEGANADEHGGREYKGLRELIARGGDVSSLVRKKVPSYVCGFRNSNGGVLCLGISDDRVVEGVKWGTLMRNDTYRAYEESVKDIYPHVPSPQHRMVFVPVVPAPVRGWSARGGPRRLARGRGGGGEGEEGGAEGGSGGDADEEDDGVGDGWMRKFSNFVAYGGHTIEEHDAGGEGGEGGEQGGEQKDGGNADGGNAGGTRGDGGAEETAMSKGKSGGSPDVGCYVVEIHVHRDPLEHIHACKAPVCFIEESTGETFSRVGEQLLRLERNDIAHRLGDRAVPGPIDYGCPLSSEEHVIGRPALTEQIGRALVELPRGHRGVHLVGYPGDGKSCWVWDLIRWQRHADERGRLWMSRRDREKMKSKGQVLSKRERKEQWEIEKIAKDKRDEGKGGESKSGGGGKGASEGKPVCKFWGAATGCVRGGDCTFLHEGKGGARGGEDGAKEIASISVHTGTDAKGKEGNGGTSTARDLTPVVLASHFCMGALAHTLSPGRFVRSIAAQIASSTHKVRDPEKEKENDTE